MMPTPPPQDGLTLPDPTDPMARRETWQEQGDRLRYQFANGLGGSALDRMGATDAMRGVNSLAALVGQRPMGDPLRARLASMIPLSPAPFSHQQITGAAQGYDIRRGGFGDALKLSVLDDPELAALLKERS